MSSTDAAQTGLTIEALTKAIDAVVATIVDHASELTDLDMAIGDGDHGLNMKRGFEAVRGAAAKIAAQTPADALKTIGTTLIMTVGGASGPLYGSLFLAMSKAVADRPIDLVVAAEMLEAGIQAVQSRGKSHAGEKTMLETLIPVGAALTAAGPAADPAALTAALKAAAAAGAASTVPLRASKGRASFLGERSIGHMDPGARSSELMVGAVCDAFFAPAP
ncbi:dihydroxyacetone kinase subunit L [Siculibacillus lacustris]|uniref:Dihydroxyacetone kinase subunit L n=1 Tax=Siculibacillus lacustris TaxID=1549641 RepID=A0A4Q9VPC3_9HYPH|nr:dihydroxyacetone kinase subunit DhaL [Siculibacillus lacustris]TBW36752.1 dihydroxyacetone kinase subunit L [Siculibacillus lacustris]